jgi:hypothetical protein
MARVRVRFLGVVQTAQIAPTILKLLGLDPKALRAVGIEHTGALPIGGQGDESSSGGSSDEGAQG